MCQKQNKGFKFDEMHIIESLPEGERTGKALELSLKGKKNLVLDPEKIHYHYVYSKADLFTLLSKIAQRSESFYPIIHFEIHGCVNEKKEKIGLFLDSHEVVLWDELAFFLRPINYLSKNNLFITMAVCFGACLLKTLHGTMSSPCWGFVGSFETLLVPNLEICYNRFYESFLTKYNVNEALTILAEEHHKWIEDHWEELEKQKDELKKIGFDIDRLDKYEYRFIYSEEIFKAYMTPIIKASDSALDERFEKVWPEFEAELGKANKELCRKNFKELTIYSREFYLRKYANIFFMTSNVPENAKNVEDFVHELSR